MKSQYIVMTTINAAESLDTYAEHISEAGGAIDAHILVIGDKKVHPDIGNRIAGIQKRYGDIVEWWGFNEQVAWLKRYAPNLIDDIPAHSDNRRNVGYLIALSRGADMFVSVDDDNFPVRGDNFVLGHAVCGESYAGEVTTEPQWFNVMSLLEADPAVPIWPRGFPYHQRHRLESGASEAKEAIIGVNVGLWLGDPDIDAISRIAISPDVKHASSQVILQGPFTPINTQNTAVLSTLAPTYYYLRQKEPLFGWPVDRFGDIWQGLLTVAITTHLGYAIRAGSPMVRQDRNPHDLLADLRQELPGILVNEWFAEKARNFQFAGSDPADCVAEFWDSVCSDHVLASEFPRDVLSFFRGIRATSTSWTQACMKLGLS